MKNTIKITASMAVLAGLLIAPNVLASEVTKEGTEITVTEPPTPSAEEEPKNAVEQIRDLCERVAEDRRGQQCLSVNPWRICSNLHRYNLER